MIKLVWLGRSALVGLVIILIFGSCTHTPVIPLTPAVSFSKQVQAIIVANCAMSGCHNASGGELFPLITYQEITGRNMVVAGNAKSSRLYQTINGSGGENAMPPSGSLSNDDVLLIYLWIEQGAKNN